MKERIEDIGEPLRERKTTIVGKTDLEKRLEEEANEAMELQKEISNIFISKNIKIRTAYMTCMALAEALYYYATFGGPDDK